MQLLDPKRLICFTFRDAGGETPPIRSVPAPDPSYHPNEVQKLSRRVKSTMFVDGALKKLICCLLSGALLCSQFAVAGYACPNAAAMKAMTQAESGRLSQAGAPREGVMPGAMNSDCDQIDREAINLCVEHCGLGSQTVDSARAPAVPTPTFVVLYVVPLKPEASSDRVATLPRYDAVLAASPPPHAILHCVFLI